MPVASGCGGVTSGYVQQEVLWELWEAGRGAVV